MSVSSKKIEQITYYYLFHKQIELIFNFEKNFLYKNQKNFFDYLINKSPHEYFYVIDINWINCWKKYSGYNKALNYLEKIDNKINSEKEFKNEIEEICKNMVLTEEITDSEDYKPPIWNNERYGNIFIHKIIFNLKDFDCLVDENTYNLLKELADEPYIFKPKTIYLRGMVLDKIIILLINEEKKIKFIFHRENENNKNLLQFTMDFTLSLGIKPFNVYGIFNDYAEWKFNQFKDNYLSKNDSDAIINLLIKDNSYEKNNSIKYTETGEIYYVLNNDKEFKEELKNDSLLTNIKFENVKTARFVGLDNIGATCYMNATLQCLINTDALTRYLLTQSNYMIIMNNINIYELTNFYCDVLLNVCCNEKIKSYKPTKFKQIISRKNPLFQGIQANDSKDLINFLLEEMNNELINLSNKNNMNDNFSSFNPDQKNKYQMLEFFKIMTKKNNKSIISKIFFILMENTTKCQICNITKYNYQVSFFLEFPLATIYKFCNDNNIPTKKNNRICIPLFVCFEHYRQNTFFTGENKIYCNICKNQNDAIYGNNIYSLPPTLILILNRGKGNIFDCDVDFPQNLNLQNFVLGEKSNFNYKLRGVITHLGESGMGGHFIAYCRHRITNNWYCYNDSSVSLCQDQENDFRKGTPYILFYESIDGKNNFIFDESVDIENINNNQQNNKNININNNQYNINNLYNNLNMNNNMGLNFMNNMNNRYLLSMNNNMNNNPNMVMNNMNNSNMVSIMNNMNMGYINMNNINNMNCLSQNNFLNMNLMNNNMIMNNINSMNNFM